MQININNCCSCEIL